jgi:hypothetical protein
LLEIGHSKDLITGFVDDAALCVEASSTELTIAKLQILTQRCDIWAKRHASVFAWQKYELIHFVHKGDYKTISDRERPLDLGDLNGVTRVFNYLAKLDINQINLPVSSSQFAGAVRIA